MSLPPISSSPLPVDRPTSARDAGGVATAGSGTDAVATNFAAMLAGAFVPTPIVQVAKLAAGLVLVEEPTDEKGTEEGKASDHKAIDGKASDRKAIDGKAADDQPAEVSANVTQAMLAALGAAAQTLDPALRDKLAIVAQRMKDEYGLEVKVVEGFRPQSRQDQLFAQGRTTDGPVVTWTRNSQHTKGRAADLVIDGGYDNATGFAMLRKIATEEGLHTLGARDPGHVELRGANSLDGMIATSEMAAVPRQSLVSAVSPVARVATVAKVATVAAPAAVAVPGTVVGSISQGGKRGAAEDGSAEKPPQQHQGQGQGAEQIGAHSAASHAYSAMETRAASPVVVTAAPGASSLAAGPSTASRVDRLMDVQDAPGPRSISRLTLSLDGGDQVRIGMRGNSVGASFDMRDTAGADRISSRLGELTRALESRGLEADAFQVRSPSAVREADATRATGLGTSSLRDVAGTASARNEGRPDMNGDAHQRFAQQDEQQERARRRQEEQRRANSIFSLGNEDK